MVRFGEPDQGDGDGFDDLAIPAGREDLESAGATDAGAAHVLYGSATGLSAARSQFWTQDSPGLLGMAQASDMLGYAAVTADFDGDGRADLALDVLQEDVAGAADAGAVAVLYGSSSGITATGNQLWHQDRPGVGDHAEPGDRFGEALGSP